MRWLRKGRRRERGQALVEFAFVGVVFFLIVFGMIDVGRAVWNYNTLAQATREGTRYAIVHGANSSDPSGPGSPYYSPPSTDSNVTEEVEKYVSGMDPDHLTVDADWIDGDNQTGDRVQVTSGYSYQPIFNLFGMISIDMSSSSTMEITY